MNLRDFLKSPNKHKRVPHATTVKKDLDYRYKKLINGSKQGKFKYEIFKVSKTYYIKVFVPSESDIDLKYDIIIKLKPSGDSKSVFSYELQTITNSPSFIYFYTYVYKQEGLLITDKSLLKNIPKIAYTKKPKVTNPYLIILYEKTIYYALKFLFETEGLDTTKIEKKSKKVKINKITMTSFNEIMKKRKILTNKNKKNIKKKDKKNINEDIQTLKTKVSKSITKSKLSNKSKTTKYTKRI